MLVIPVTGDKITTKDDSDQKVVSSFTSLKDEPAVYLKSLDQQYVFYSDIVEINGVRVEYDLHSNMFNALGPLRRKFNLPQPKDSIKVKLIDVSYKDETELIEVTGLKLHSKKYGAERGLIVQTKDGNFSLSDILDIERRTGSEKFVPEKFKKYYFDYLPINVKVKK